MAYIITLKLFSAQLFVRAPLVAEEYSEKEAEGLKMAKGLSDEDIENLNDDAFRRNLLERPYLVCRKFKSGRRIVVPWDNIGLIEELKDADALKRLDDITEELKKQVEAEAKKAGAKDVTGQGEIVKPPFIPFKPGPGRGWQPY